MIRRHANQGGVTWGGGVEVDGAHDVAGEVVVRQLNGFRRRGGARGEQHHGRRIWVGELSGGFCRVRGSQEVRRGDGGGTGLTERVAVPVVDDHQRLGQPSDERAQTVGGQSVVQRCDRYRRAGRGEQQQRQHRPAATDVGDVLGTRGRDDTGPTVGKRVQFLDRQPQFT